jgi:hypothetical protein
MTVMVGEPIDGLVTGAFDGVTRTLLRDLRERFGSYFEGPNADPLEDITESAVAEFNEKSRSPQIVVTDFSSELMRTGGIEEMDLATDLDAMTADVTKAPDLYMVEFTVTVVSRQRWAARRMADDLTRYFTRAPHVLTMDVSDEYAGGQVNMRKGLARAFVDATVSPVGGLMFIEGRGRLYDVPMFDDAVEKRYLVKAVQIAVKDQSTGDTLAAVEVEAGQ